MLDGFLAQSIQNAPPSVMAGGKQPTVSVEGCLVSYWNFNWESRSNFSLAASVDWRVPLGRGGLFDPIVM